MRLLIPAAVVAFSLCSSIARCAEPPALPPELKLLDPYVGTWTVAEFVSKKAEWTPEEVRTSGETATTKWIMNGWYLEERNSPGQGTEHLGIWNYDRCRRRFNSPCISRAASAPTLPFTGMRKPRALKGPRPIQTASPCERPDGSRTRTQKSGPQSRPTPQARCIWI